MVPTTLKLALFIYFTTAFAFAETPRAQQSFTPKLFNGLPNAGGQAIAWADYDRDGDLDLVVGYQHQPVQLYRNTSDGFELAPIPSELSRDADYRSLSWGEFNGDGYPDLYVGFGRDSQFNNLLFAGSDRGFLEVATPHGVDARGTSRQATWVDIDSDGDSDLFVAMRDRTSKLYRNDGEHFTNISASSGLADPRRSVGAVWLDFDDDGDIDLYLPNQSGDRDGFFENKNMHFRDIANSLGMDLATRPIQEGSVGATACDFNGDGHLDIFVPVYGKDMLWINDGEGGFTNEASQWRVDSDALAVGADCGDLNNDGRNDLIVVGYQRGVANGYDHIYFNKGDHFIDVFPRQYEAFDGDHGVRLADFDDDGDLDFVTTNRHAQGKLSLWVNNLEPTDETHFLKVWVLDNKGTFTRQGDEVHVYDLESNTLINSGIVDTGGGYISQNMLPVHLGIGRHTHVRVEVISAFKGKQRVTTINNVSANQTITVRVPTG